MDFHPELCKNTKWTSILSCVKIYKMDFYPELCKNTKWTSILSCVKIQNGLLS